MEYIYVLYLLLIILIIVAGLLLMSISGKPLPFFDNPVEIRDDDIKTIDHTDDSKINGGKPDTSKKIYVVDGLNYIYDQFLTINKQANSTIKEENIISNYPNIAYVWKAIQSLRAKYKKDSIVFVIKNHDGYKLSIYDDRLYKKWAKMYKIGIVMCYDPDDNKGAHYVKGRDDKTVCEIYDKYKSGGYNVELISKDNYNDKNMFVNIPSFKKIKYGSIPFIDI